MTAEMGKSEMSWVDMSTVTCKHLGNGLARVFAYGFILTSTNPGLFNPKPENTFAVS